LNNWRYRFDTSGDPDSCVGGCNSVFPDDDGVRCCGPTQIHHNLWVLLVEAMEKEANAGALNTAMWAPTFPRRTIELVLMCRERAAAALESVLPVVLVDVVCDYYMAGYLAN